MKIWSKLFIVLLIGSLLFPILGVCAFATESEVVEEPAVEDTVKPVMTLDDIEFVFRYTSDSVSSKELSVQTYTDPISEQSGIELVPNFGAGYVIYDDPDTEIIDGIRINGAEVYSLRIPISSETALPKYEVAVRTVYAKGASGTLAQVLDGAYDYSQLLTNPVILFQIVYWVCMALVGIIGLYAAIRNKGKKVKSADEIAGKVTENIATFEERIINTVTELVKAEILPLAQSSVASGKEAVKAILLSTSKSKEAPSAILDVFKESLDIDISNIIDDVREELSKAAVESSEKHAENANALRAIANNVIQEDVKNATETVKPETQKTQKSVF